MALRPLRRILLGASRSRWLAGQLRDRAFLRRAVRRFMPGEGVGAALGEAAALAQWGIGSVLTQLGEQVTSAAEADGVRDHYLDVLDQVRAHRSPADISVKLTHLGLDGDRAACLSRLRALVERSHETGGFVWVDMEESRYVDATLDLYHRIHAEHPAVGVCVQAYLRRTPADLELLLSQGANVRLVKGAYNEPPSAAWPAKTDVDRQYSALALQLLERADGSRTVLGTHDRRLIDRLSRIAADRGIRRGAYEIHMLYGIRVRDQRELAATGHAVRTLISYGTAWFAWYMRRLAERPANVWFVVKSLMG